MKKVRINELARELEVKAHEILERLPELGVTEKKTHSSSIDEDVAIRLRRFYGLDVPDYVPGAEDETEAEAQVDHPAQITETPATRDRAVRQRPRPNHCPSRRVRDKCFRVRANRFRPRRQQWFAPAHRRHRGPR